MGKSTITLFSLTGLTLLSGLILSSSRVSADNSVIDEVNIVVPVSCSLSGVGMTSHNTSINNGTYASDIGTTALKASCNDLNGFAIYAAGYTGDEVGGTDSTKLVGENDIGNILTGTGTSGNSQWAMKLATDSNATYPITIESDANGSFASYHIVPEDFVKVASRNSSTDIGSASIGAVLTTTYQVYISATQPAGTYSGKVIYALVHPANHSAPVICNENATTISEVKCMQDFATVSSTNRTAIVNSMTLGQQYTLKDKRDGKTYTVAKLADGNVWMTQNLDLNLDSGTTYTNLDTDIGYNTSTGTYDTAAWSPTRSTYATTLDDLHAWCQGGIWDSENYTCTDNTIPESYDAGDLYWNGTPWPLNQADCISANGVWDDDWCSGVVVSGSTGIAQYHLGNYYNWAAALATNDSSVFGAQNQNEIVEQSICPVGWTLPRSHGSVDTFQGLWEAYGYDDEDGIANVSTLWSNPLYMPPSGYYVGGIYGVGFDGNFWSAVAAGSTDARAAAFYVVNSTYPTNIYVRGNAFSVRCIARPVVSE